jgi:hypothetical protein
LKYFLAPDLSTSISLWRLVLYIHVSQQGDFVPKGIFVLCHSCGGGAYRDRNAVKNFHHTGQFFHTSDEPVMSSWTVKSQYIMEIKMHFKHLIS